MSAQVNPKQPGNCSSVVEEENSNEGRQTHCPLWTPFFLRRPIMVVFLMSFLSCLGAVIALYVYTQRENHSLGIKTDGEKYYYLWTYGPTAVFTVLTAGWTQAEYRASQLMPWVLMHRGSTPASQSIFLDYLSKLNVVSLYQSLKQRHFLVSLCVAGSLILNGITVFSTGLFELESVLITRPTNVLVSHKFSGDDYNPNVNDERSFAACMAFFGLNMTRPVGLSETFVYTPFQPVNSSSTEDVTIPTNRTYQAEVEIFEPSFDCQNGSVSWERHIDFGTVSRDFIVYTTPDGCRFEQYSPTSVLTETESNIGVAVAVAECQGQRFNYSETSQKPYTNNWDLDWRLWAAVGPSLSYHMSLDERINFTAWENHPMHLTVCKPHYNVYRGPVRIWREDGQSAVSTHIARERLNITNKIADVPASMLFYSGFDSAFETYTSDKLPNNYKYTFAANGTSRDEFWADMAVFNDAVTGSFSCLMQQTVKDKLLKHDPHYIDGTEQFIEDRLFVRQMSFCLMAALLVMLIAIVVVLLCFFVPVAVCPRDVGSIAGVATILSESSEFMGAFDGMQCRSEDDMIKTTLGQTQYSTLVDTTGTFMLCPQDRSSFRSLESQNGADNSSTWWYPFSATWFIRVTVVLVPIAVIIGLEVVYHISTSRRGITLVDGKSPYIHYIWVYVPALIMFIIRCLFTSVEFGARVVQPYSRLREGRAPPETTIFENQLRKIGPYAVFDTLRKKQWSPAAATISLLLATINPIVVSGLFTSKVSGPTSAMSLTQITRWNLGNTSDPSQEVPFWQLDNFNADHASGLILSLNLTDPQWTYKDLAFPKFALTSTNQPLPDAGFINARLPAFRSRLTCAPDPANGNCEIKRKRLWCDLDSPCFYSMSADGPVNDLDYVLAQASADSSPSRPSNCSTHAILYGKKGPNNTPTSNYHYIFCNATLEEVEVDTKLQLPSLAFDTDTPPKIVEGSARTPFKTTHRSFPTFSELSFYLFKSDPNFNDAFLEAISQGVDGVPLPELLDPDILSARINTVWGIIMAQLLNSGGREPFDVPFNKTYMVEPATMEAPIYTGVFQDGRKYLVQNELSTRLLEGVLSCMVACGLIALFVMRTERVLHKSPTSIASVASLLYGSRILNSVLPGGSEWWSDEDFQKRGLFEGRSFSMGWWEVKRQRNWDGSGASSISTLAEDEGQAQGVFDRTPSPLSEPDGRKQPVRFGIDIDTEDALLLRDIARI